MKLIKEEKIWLLLCALGYLFYNLPGVPPYGDVRGAIIHGVISVVWIWLVSYIGFFVVNRCYALRDQNGEEESDTPGQSGDL